MIDHYLKSAFRSLWNNKVFTGINILGLAVSFSIAIVIYLIVDYHFSFDEFHQDKNRIFRVTTTSYFGDQTFPNSGAPVPLSKIIESEISGIEQAAFFHRQWFNEATVINSDGESKVFEERNQNSIFTDSRYFDLFQYKWLAGSKSSLDEPNNLVITDRLANKYFGKTSYEMIIGQQISFDGKPPVPIAGIVQTLEGPTEFIFAAFLSLSTLESSHYEFYNDWDGVNSNDQLFVKLNKGILAPNVENQILEIVGRHSNREENGNQTYDLQPIEDIHFNGKYANYKNPRAHKPTLFVLIVITSFLLILSLINFVNLTTALTRTRAREIGVRKTLGSLKSQLAFHMVLETFAVVLLASACAVALLPSIFRVFSGVIPSEIMPFEIMKWEKLIFLFGLILSVTIATGLFPISTLHRYKQVNLLKSQFAENRTSKRFGYQAFTILQFSISILIIIATLSIQKQIMFSLHKDLGYQKEAIINFRAPSEKIEVLHREIKNIPGVLNVALGGNPPASGATSSSTYHFENEGEAIEVHVDIKNADDTYIKLYDIELLAGTPLPYDDTTRCLVNQAFLRKVGISDPSQIIGRFLGDIQIVGVVKDFHMKSTYMPINPAMIVPRQENYNTFHIELNRSTVHLWEETIHKIESAWQEISTENFSYQFYDEQIAAFYQTEKSMIKLLTWISGITIFISCLGLLGMAVFTINRRVKEIGIRKVNGAKVTEILALLNKDFVKWVAIAFIIATPIAWYAMNKWLESFAYKTELSWWIFALAGLLALGIALLTVSWQSWKAATRNPVEALRYE